MESEIWSTFATLRISSAINGLAGLFAIWLASRWASVAMEKGVNTLAKVILSVFGLCVIAMNGFFLMTAQSIFINTSKTFAMLRDGGTEISPAAANFIATYNADAPALMNTPIFSLLLLAALLVILLPMWMPAEK
ncbi:MAG: hypothetical protein P8M77_05850 [Porticoccaceae bacterium]|nr:hypothetical protein [Porticoccaceae bacterium]